MPDACNLRYTSLRRRMGRRGAQKRREEWDFSMRAVQRRPESQEPALFVQANLLRRLLNASAEEIAPLVMHLSPSQRAQLAYSCYVRGHLHTVGLSIAALCDLQSLVVAAPSDGAGAALHAQSREPRRRAAPVLTGRRPVTLATSAVAPEHVARMIALAANDEPEVELESTASA